MRPFTYTLGLGLLVALAGSALAAPAATKDEAKAMVGAAIASIE
jgi:hypothetical protein